MALLGQGFDDPQSAAIMALAGGLLQKNFAGGLLGANNAYAQGKESQRRAAMDQMQMDMAKEDREFKRKAMELDARKKAEGQAFLRDLIGGGASYEPGQLGSGSFGAVGNADPMAAPTRRAGGLANVTPEQIAAAKAMYGYDLTEPWKVAKQGFELKPNSFRVDPATNRREYIGDPKEGYTYQNGTVGTMPGWLEAQTARTLATEGPKALLNSAAALNLRKNPDGTESPVSALSENPMLQGVLSNLFGGAPIPRAMPQGGARTEPALPRPEAGMMGNFVGNPNDVTGAIANIKDPQERANAQAALEAQMRAGGGVLRNSPPTPGQGYGKTTAQETKDAARKVYVEGVAKDMVEVQKNIQAAGFTAPTTIARLQQVGGMLEGVDGGVLTPMGTQLASMASSMGFKVDKNLSNKEAASALAYELAMNKRVPGTGSMSERDMDILLAQTPQMSQTAEGRRKIIANSIAVAKREQQVAKFASNYVKKHGQLDNGFFDQMREWTKVNSIFEDK